MENPPFTEDFSVWREFIKLEIDGRLFDPIDYLILCRGDTRPKSPNHDSWEDLYTKEPASLAHDLIDTAHNTKPSEVSTRNALLQSALRVGSTLSKKTNGGYRTEGEIIASVFWLYFGYQEYDRCRELQPSMELCSGEERHYMEKALEDPAEYSRLMFEKKDEKDS